MINLKGQPDHFAITVESLSCKDGNEVGTSSQGMNQNHLPERVSEACAGSVSSGNVPEPEAKTADIKASLMPKEGKRK